MMDDWGIMTVIVIKVEFIYFFIIGERACLVGTVKFTLNVNFTVPITFPH